MNEALRLPRRLAPVWWVLIEVPVIVGQWLEQREGLESDYHRAVLLCLTPSWAELHKKDKKRKVFQILQAVGLTYTDMGSDVYLCLYYASPRHAKAPKQMGRKRMGVLSRKLAELGCVAVPMAIVLCEFTYFTGTPAAAAYTAR